MTKRTSASYSPEVRARAVRMVLEHQSDHPSQWAAMTSIASKIGCTAETLRKWVDPSRKSGGALHRLHCFCLEFDGACEVQRRVPTDWIIEPIDVSGYGSFSLAS